MPDDQSPRHERGDRYSAARSTRRLAYHATGRARPMPAGRVLVTGLVALLLAALLNADPLYAEASRMPFGWKRTVARAAVTPFREVSHLTGLNKPNEWLREAVGREPASPADADSQVTIPQRSPDVPPVPEVLRSPTPAEPLRTWVVGDSMMAKLGSEIVEDIDGRDTIEAELEFRISSGLTRPDFFDWPLFLQQDVLPTDPEVVVAMFGANDAQPMEVGGEVVDVRSAAWQAEYRRRVAGVMDQLGGGGRLIIWVGQPAMREADFDRRQAILDGIYRAEAGERSWVRYIDTRTVLSDGAGRAGYDAYLADGAGSESRARLADGVHLTVFGADLLADAVVATLDAELSKVPYAPLGGAEVDPGGDTGGDTGAGTDRDAGTSDGG